MNIEYSSHFDAVIDSEEKVLVLVWESSEISVFMKMSNFGNLKLKNCSVCRTRLDYVPKRGIRRISDIEMVNKLNTVKPIILTNKRKEVTNEQVSPGDLVCNGCRQFAMKYEDKTPKTPNIYPSLPSTSAVGDNIQSTSQEDSSQLPSAFESMDIDDNIIQMTLKIPRTAAFYKNCVVCGEKKGLVNVPTKAFFDTFITSNILIPRDSKSCPKHLSRKNVFLRKCLNNLEIVSDDSVLTNDEIQMLLTSLRQTSKYTLFERFSKRKNISEEECKQFTGLNKEQFNEVLCSLESLKESPSRTKAQALAVYLFWLRTGLDHRTIASLFSIDNYQTISAYNKQVRNALLKDFVPKHLGVSHLSREQWVKENTLMAKTIFDVPDDKLILVADGTYLYHGKSLDNELQRKSFSMQKGRHLSKPFVICITSGRIVDIYGLYPASQNDATILETIFKSNKDLRKLIEADDHILLDRGFRNVIDTLEKDYHLNTHMPVCKKPNQKQMTVQEANLSRLITKCRWIIETINGHLKNTFRINSKVLRTVTLEHSIDDWRISAALLNRFYHEYEPDLNEINIATRMKTKLNVPNRLETILNEHQLDRKRKDFTKLSPNSVRDFPKLTISEISDNITYGPYQIEQAKSYIKENFKSPETATIEIFTDRNNILNNDNLVLLRSRVQSRHVNSKQYYTYITFNKTLNSVNSIQDTICTCNAGKRTMGACAHATSVILYLSNTRYNSSKKTLVNTEKVYCNAVTSESSESEDDTIVYPTVDTNEQHIDSDDTIIDEPDLGNVSSAATIYPDLSSLTSQL